VYLSDFSSLRSFISARSFNQAPGPSGWNSPQCWESGLLLLDCCREPTCEQPPPLVLTCFVAAISFFCEQGSQYFTFPDMTEGMGFYFAKNVISKGLRTATGFIFFS